MRIFRSFPLPMVVFFFLSSHGILAQSSFDSSFFTVKPYLQYSTKNSIRILWETRDSTTATVKFGRARLNVKKAELSQEEKVLEFSKMHEVVLENLGEETNYFWQVHGNTQDGRLFESDIYSFKTAVGDSSAFMFALIGDSQKNNRTPWAWDSIARKVWQDRPNFIVHAGDLVDWGPAKSDWTEHFFKGGQPLMSRIPMYTVLGNHEGDADYYYQYMSNPMPEWKYHFRYGNTDFFMIDTNRDVTEGSAQYNWLERVLAQSTAKWKIAIHHHPPYSSETDDHGNAYFAKSTLGTHARDLTPLYDKYNVDFCLFGHTHVYERTWPLKNNMINEKNGTVYINSGGAGGGLESFTPTRNWFTLELEEGHHYCTFAIHDGTLFFKAIDHRGRIFDSFQMKKDNSNNQLTVLQPPTPMIETDNIVFEKSTTVNLEASLDDLKIYFTLDGSVPDSSTTLYRQPFTISEDCTLKTCTYTADHKKSRIVEKEFIKMNPISSSPVTGEKRGLKYVVIEGDWRDKKEKYFIENAIKSTGIKHMVNLDKIKPKENYWGIAMDGFLNIPKTDTYHFYALSSEGLTLTLDNKFVVYSDDENQTIKSVVLEKGYHKISIKSYQRENRKLFSVGYYNPDLGRVPFSPHNLAHE